MRVDVSRSQISVKNILENPNHMITLDANFFLPPNRQKTGMSNGILNGHTSVLTHLHKKEAA